MRGNGFPDFVKENQAALFGFAVTLTGDRHEAEEVVAGALEKVCRKWQRIRGMEHPRAYARRVVLTEFLKGRDRQNRLLPTEDLSSLIPPIPDLAERHARHDDLQQRLQALPNRQRAVVVLRYLLDLDDAEIAAELGCRVGTVRAHASRALAALRLEMREAQNPEPDRARLLSSLAHPLPHTPKG